MGIEFGGVRQAMLQPPQFVESVAVSMHDPPQQVPFEQVLPFGRPAHSPASSGIESTTSEADASSPSAAVTSAKRGPSEVVSIEPSATSCPRVASLPVSIATSSGGATASVTSIEESPGSLDVSVDVSIDVSLGGMIESVFASLERESPIESAGGESDAPSPVVF
jgi:hypothetical protein